MSKDFTYEGSTGPKVPEYELMGTSTDGPFGCILRREDKQMGQADYKELSENLEDAPMQTHADAVVGQRMNLKMEVMDLPDGVTIDSYKWTIPDVKFKSWTPDQTKAVLETFSDDDEDLERQKIQFYWVDAEPKEVTCVATLSDGTTVTATEQILVVAPTVNFTHTIGRVQFSGAGNDGSLVPVGDGPAPRIVGLAQYRPHPELPNRFNQLGGIV